MHLSQESPKPLDEEDTPRPEDVRHTFYLLADGYLRRHSRVLSHDNIPYHCARKALAIAVWKKAGSLVTLAEAKDYTGRPLQFGSKAVEHSKILRNQGSTCVHRPTPYNIDD